MSDQSTNFGHGARIGNQIRAMSIVLGIFTVASLVAYVTIGSLALLLLAACAAGWGVLLIYYLMNRGVIEPVGNAIGRIIVPDGASTPSVAQHSNIEAMEMKGRYAEAAQAYRDVMASQPADIVACEKLGQLALRQLKDYDLAVFAYREAEKRSTEPKRQLGYATLIAGIYRDNMKNYGKAVVELRRIVEQYPQAPNRARLSAEIDELKAHHFGTS